MQIETDDSQDVKNGTSNYSTIGNTWQSGLSGSSFSFWVDGPKFKSWWGQKLFLLLSWE